jgi:hypothetical protein
MATRLLVAAQSFECAFQLGDDEIAREIGMTDE